ncbi:MAG: hypothetical protein AB2693_28795 [Candidatus Thiodiazotropha sp.]
MLKLGRMHRQTGETFGDPIVNVETNERDLCDEKRELKDRQYEAEGAKEYRKDYKRIQKAVKKSKEDWTCIQCEI